MALSEGPTFEDYASGAGQYDDQALLQRLADRLRERRVRRESEKSTARRQVRD